MAAEIHIAGRSKHLEHLRKQVARLAANRKDVLVVGEPGVGKSMVASLIVAGDAVRVFDLASKNEEELHAELDSISHGAVVFEGVEDAGYRTQDEVLKFIESRPKSIQTIVTLCGSTKEFLAQRKLAENLCARINSFEKVEIRPLRERREDIPALVKHFAQGLVIDINTLDTLVNLPWQGNVRQLKSVVERCIASGTDGKFVLPEELVDERTEVVRMVSGLMQNKKPILDKSLDAIENTIIRRTLERFGFNESKAAQFLGMTEQIFGQKLKRLATIEPNSR